MSTTPHRRATASLDQILRGYSSRSRAAISRAKNQPRRWAGYATAAGASLAAAATAEAAVQHVVPASPIRLELNDNLASISSQTTSVDFNNDGAFDLFFTMAASTYGTGYLYQIGLAQSIYYTVPNEARILTAGTTPYVARKFASGELISDGVPSASLAIFHYAGLYDDVPFETGQWSGSDSGVAGVRFQAGGQNHFGWVHVAVESNPDGPNSLEIREWAYQDIPDAPIAAGQIPEPTALSLSGLALGAAGLAALRRRRRQ